MQQANPRSQRNKRLHVVYFVDAARTKSLSVSLKALALGGAGVLALFAAAGVSLFTTARLAVQAHASREYVRELKRGVLAQSVAYEHVLTGNATEEEREEFSRAARALEREIAANADAPVRSDARGNKPLDLAKVTSKLSNLDIATLNLVAAGGDDGKSGSGAEGVEGIDGSGEGGNPDGGRGTTPPAKPGSAATGGAAPAGGDRAPGVANGAAGSNPAGKSARVPPLLVGAAAGMEASAVPGGVSLSARGPAGIPGAGVAATPVRVTFDRVELVPQAASQASPAGSPARPAGDSDQSEGAENDEAPVSGGPKDAHVTEGERTATEPPATAPNAAEPTSSRLRFVLSNHTPPRLLTGRVCAVAVVVDPVAGNETVRTVPAGLKVQGASSTPTGCPGGQLVRFSRLRPTELALPVPPARVKSVTLHFSEGPGSSLHSHAWSPPAKVPGSAGQ